MRTSLRRAHARRTPSASPVATGGALLPAFTLIELLVATAISSIVMILLASALVQLFQVSAQTSSRLALAGDAALAVQTLARDVNSAATATIASAHSLTLSQPDPQGAAPHTVSYVIAAPLLMRSENGEQQIIARRLSEASRFEPTGVVTGTRLIVVRLVSALGEESIETAVELGLRSQP